ncbi:tetratricopeptide repeat protein [Algimonas porphyrae]|uniref:M48 family metallopeptidase n=1 Tax=Algimonas porphyrae TaxID=1128113 RepID=UPI0024E09FE2|nr:M48 family metallopeptidase [Algimonas porphyrae]
MKADRVLSRILLISGLVCSVAACATTDAGSRAVGAGIQDSSSRLASLEYQSNKFEDDVRLSGGRIKDPGLITYVDSLVQKAAGEYAGELRVYLIEAPVFNAFMLPNGAMAVYSGLMLRADSEAELFAVLGHEFGHYVEQHSLERVNRAENTNNAMTFVNVATLGYASPLVLLAGVGDYFSFSREQESEADLIGFDRMVEAGYVAEAASRIWSNLQAEEQASSNKKRRKRGNRSRSALFDSHPTPQLRLDALREKANGLRNRSQKDNAAAYRARIRPFLLDWYTVELQMRDYGAILNLLERKRSFDEDLGVLDYVEGRVYMLRNNEGDHANAIRVWKRGAERPDAPPVLYRDLGDLYQKLGREDEARQAFQSYLEAAPDAPDAALVRSMMKT